MGSIKNKIKELNKGKLNKLDLSGIKISGVGVPKELTKTISDNKNVQLRLIELDLSFNSIKITQFLEEFGNMSSEFSTLESLNLSANPIVNDWNMSIIKSSQSISRWNVLTELTLVGCKITKLTNTSFTHLIKLKKLILSNNSIDSIEDQCFSPFKHCIEEISLAGNTGVKQIPISLLECKQIEVLDLSGCGLTSLPDNFGVMGSLLELNVGNNKLLELPNSIGKMKRLCFLNVQDNSLSDLPISLGYCIGLSSSQPGLNIYGNPLNKNMDLNNRKSRGTAELMDYCEKRIALHIGPILLTNISSSGSGSGIGSNNTTTTTTSSGNRPPSYDKINQVIDRPPQYSSIGVSSTPISPTSSSSSPSPSSPFNNSNHDIFNIPGPKPIKDQIQTMLRQDIKSTIKRIYELMSASTSSQPTTNNTVQTLITLGNVITAAQQEFDKLFTCLNIPTNHLTYNSPLPINSDEKIVQIKKILNLKLEKMAVYSKCLLDYIDHQNQIIAQQSSSPSNQVDYDKRISLIFNSLKIFYSKLIKLQ